MLDTGKTRSGPGIDRMLTAARGAREDRVQGVRGREIWERRLDPSIDW